MIVNFIMCDNDTIFCNELENEIKTVTKNYPYRPVFHIFHDYNDKFINIINTNLENKVYILDIKTENRSGTEIASIIRQKDIKSYIIFVTGYYNDYINDMLENNYLFLAFISKKDYKDKLKKAVQYALEHLNTNNIVRFNDNNITNTILIEKILYVSTEKSSRKLIVETDYRTFTCNKTLKEFRNMLNDNFIQTSQSCYINKDRLVSFDKKERIITFDNGKTIDLVSRKYIKEILKILKN